MKTKKNRRTLKKRIQRIMFLCIFITIILFGGSMMVLSALFSKAQAEVVSKYMSASIAHNMNSEFALKQLKIKGLEEFNPDTPEAKEWLSGIERSLKLNLPAQFSKDAQEKSGEELHIEINNRDALSLMTLNNMINISIELNGRLVYENKRSLRELFSQPEPKQTISAETKNNGIRKKLLDFYKTKQVSYLEGSSGQTVGRVTAMVSSEFTLILYSAIAVLILIIAFLSIITVNIISRFFAYPLITPIRQLDQKIKALASDNYEATAELQIVLKKPLREIESMAFSTNAILNKMRSYNSLLLSQKEMLENQNDELEAQNVELADSKRQIEDAQAQLVQTENMASVGQLTAAIAHEINTPLGAINSNVQLSDMVLNMLMIKKAVLQTPELTDSLTQLKEANDVNLMACKRVIEIIKSLKTFSRLDGAEFQETNLNDDIKSVLVLTSNLWKNKVTIHQDFGELPQVKCYPGLLNQVYMNIIVNAIQAIPDKGEIFIKTSLSEAKAHISIRDTGTGIAPEHLSRIFDTGFTTKGAGIGMGMGLSISSNIINKHSGEIKVDSRPGQGTEFTIVLPVNQGAG